MATFKELTENYQYIVVNFFRFKSQTEVFYVVSVASDVVSFRLSKADLIVCINYFLNRLSKFDFYGRIKKGFVFDKFKYYELSVYLHGLIQLYSAKLGFSPVSNLYIKRFSHLPHDLLMPELKNMDVQVAKLEDMFGGTYYCCLISGIPVISNSFDTLRTQIYTRFPNIGKFYNIRLDLLDLRSLPF